MWLIIYANGQELQICHQRKAARRRGVLQKLCTIWMVRSKSCMKSCTLPCTMPGSTQCTQCTTENCIWTETVLLVFVSFFSFLISQTATTTTKTHLKVPLVSFLELSVMSHDFYQQMLPGVHHLSCELNITATIKTSTEGRHFYRFSHDNNIFVYF